MRHPREPDLMLPPAGRDKGVGRGDRPMSSLMKVAFWFVDANALAGAASLIFFSTDTVRLFFWEIKPAINAALFGALYLGGTVVVTLVTYGPSLWLYCSHLTLFGLIGLLMHWLQRKAARPSSAGHPVSAGDCSNGLPGLGTPTSGKGTR